MSRVDASPAKAFFVRMLTRDISLEDCILDLVDNSIDGAWASSGSSVDRYDFGHAKPLRSFRIYIEFDENHFSISDNCGGIEKAAAEEYAFTFGRLEERNDSEFTVGVYGIGMKRAVFKLGNDIVIKSTYCEDGATKSFEVPIDVSAWLTENSGKWDFPLNETIPNSDPGVTISVRSLHSEVSESFSAQSFREEFIRILGRDYMVSIAAGLEIYVNGRLVQGKEFTFINNSRFKPLRTAQEFGEVQVDIVAGMFRRPPESNDPDCKDTTESVSGWHVICNGRVVLSADKSSLTGWGRLFQKWHHQYSGFAGFISFKSADPSLLPMTTTKRSVDVSSEVFAKALSLIVDPTKAWISYTNMRRKDMEAAKQLERETGQVDLRKITEESSLLLPDEFENPTLEAMANISYAVPLDQVDHLRVAFGSPSMTYRDVGLSTFRYTYQDLIEEG